MTEVQLPVDVADAILSMAVVVFNEGLLEKEGIELVEMIHRQHPALASEWFVAAIERLKQQEAV